MSHLATLVEDSSTKPADKQKLRAYVKKWAESKVLLGWGTGFFQGSLFRVH